jgi:hypothetical protein
MTLKRDRNSQKLSVCSVCTVGYKTLTINLARFANFWQKIPGYKTLTIKLARLTIFWEKVTGYKN